MHLQENFKGFMGEIFEANAPSLSLDVCVPWFKEQEEKQWAALHKAFKVRWCKVAKSQRGATEQGSAANGSSDSECMEQAATAALEGEPSPKRKALHSGLTSTVSDLQKQLMHEQAMVDHQQGPVASLEVELAGAEAALAAVEAKKFKRGAVTTVLNQHRAEVIAKRAVVAALQPKLDAARQVVGLLLGHVAVTEGKLKDAIEAARAAHMAV